MGRIFHLSVLSVLLLLCASLQPIQAHAGWSHDPAVNTAITTQSGADTNPAITDDGAGGAIIAWMGLAYDIYVQRIDANGTLLWGANGKAITSGGDKYYPQLVGDGSGGAIITWQGGGDGSGNIYAQRIDGDGNALWSEGGEIVCNEPGNHQYPQIVANGIGGAIIVWQDRRNEDTDYNIYAQSIRSDVEGDLEELWPANGLEICIEAGHQYYPQLVSDGSGGVIITWQDARDGWDVYAQRIDGDGLVLWEAGGEAVAENDNYHERPQIVSDGGGGAIITWQDLGSGGNGYDVYAQRIDGDGAQVWTAYPNGLPVSTGINHQQDPQMVSDGSGGAVIAWWNINSSDGTVNGIYAQRIDGNGAALWTANGVAVATPASIDTNGYSPQITSDGSQGAVITWADQRNTTDENIYAQRISGTDGGTLWLSNGSAISTAANHQQQPRLISNGSGGAIITWRDLRNGVGDIYAQKVLADGSLPATPTLTTATPTGVTATTATSGGDITADGGATVAARGVCWGTSPNPVTGGNCTSDGSGTGPFPSSITGLSPSTPYHIRAYATNSVGTSYGSDLQFTTLAGSQLTVNLAGVGGGGGRVTSDSWGIDCTIGQCLAFFTTGSQVTLTATPDGDSIFTNKWSGDCVVTNGNCVVTMNGARSATATFDYVQPVRILGSTKPYALIGSAYADPVFVSGGTIQARVHEFTENLNFNRSISAIIKGGYDTAYNDNSGLTTVKGTVTVTSGSVTVEKLAIR